MAYKISVVCMHVVLAVLFAWLALLLAYYPGFRDGIDMQIHATKGLVFIWILCVVFIIGGVTLPPGGGLLSPQSTVVVAMTLLLIDTLALLYVMRLD